MNRVAVLRCSAVLLLAIGFCFLLNASYIHAKGFLAQYLLERAWTKTVSGDEKIRPWPWADTWPVGRLRVPRLNVDMIILEGDSGSVLAFGPGHMMWSQDLGSVGNAVISGHRDTSFRFLKDLEVGDQLDVQTTDGNTHHYIVQGAVVANQENIRLAADAERPFLTLVTCYPFDAVIPGGPERYLVFAEKRGESQERLYIGGMASNNFILGRR